jgi:hypothetical protein
MGLWIVLMPKGYPSPFRSNSRYLRYEATLFVMRLPRQAAPLTDELDHADWRRKA